MLRKFFPHVLLAPDAQGSNGGASSTPPEGSETQQQQQAKGAETAQDNDAAFEAAAQQAIETVQASATPPDDKDKKDKDSEPVDDKAAQGDDKLLITTEGEPAEDGKPKDGDKGKDKDEKKIITDKPEDAQLPFHKHERFQQVLAERDTFKNESVQYKQQYETAKPLVERQQGIESFCQQNGIQPNEFQELLQIRALMNTDPAAALEKIRPVVASLEAVAGKGIAPDLLKEVTDGLITEDRAKEITKLRAQSQLKEANQQRSQQQAQAQVVQQMEQSVNSWFQSKKTSDTAFESKVEMINGVFATLCQSQPPNSPAAVTAHLEAAYKKVNETLAKFQPRARTTKPPPSSNSSRTVPKEPESLDEFADAAVERLMAQA